MARSTILIAVAISLIIRILIIAQAPMLTYDGFSTYTQVDHIENHGIPDFNSENAWGGAHYIFMPLFHYILAFFTIFLPTAATLLIIPNIFIALLPIPVYLLSKEITKTKGAAEAVTIASSFAPLLYTSTLVASPLSLAIPLFFLTFYYFIRLGKTPKDQIPFVISIIALALTHPISLLLIPAMGLTLILTQVQKTKFSTAMVEATIFSSFLLLWASILVYKDTIQLFGAKALLIGAKIPELTITSTATLVGVIPLFAGVYAAMHYLTKEKNEAAHGVVALGLSIILMIIAQLLTITIGIFLLSIILVILSAGSVQLYSESKRRSRAPNSYRMVYGIIVSLFIITSITPAISLGLETINDVPKKEELVMIEELQKQLPENTNIYWDVERGYLLQQANFGTPVNSNLLEHPNSQEIINELSQINQVSQIRLIETLNKYDIDAIIVETNSSLPLSDRCFELLISYPMEAYRLRCVVQ